LLITDRACPQLVLVHYSVSDVLCCLRHVTCGHVSAAAAADCSSNDSAATCLCISCFV